MPGSNENKCCGKSCHSFCEEIEKSIFCSVSAKQFCDILKHRRPQPSDTPKSNEAQNGIVVTSLNTHWRVQSPIVRVHRINKKKSDQH